jgi:DNA-binding protein Fis
MDFTPYVIPALLALTAKAVIFFYARFSGQRNLETRLYLLFLFALSIQNLAEVTFFTAKAQNLASPPGGLLYFVGTIAALALFLHLALVLATDKYPRGLRDPITVLIYLPAVILELLLWSGNQLVIGLEPFAYTYTKIPGPLYFLFELYTLSYVCAGAGLLLYGGRRQLSATKRLKSRIMFLSLLPTFVVVVSVIGLQHYSSLRTFNTTFILPVALTFFLAVSAYATHHYRLFDIEFYIPWSKIRKRKTAFYDRIRGMIAEIADLGSVNQVVGRLADTLRCPVALVGGNRPVLASAGNTPALAEFPSEELHKIDHIVVANEIAEAMPRTHALMKQHGVAAIVPFYPHSQTASSWMLLGEAFSEEVYTPRDFHMVEQLFAKLSDLFLDKLIVMRTQLANAQRQARALDQRLLKTEENLAVLQKENRDLREQNTRLMTESAAMVRAAVLGRADVDDGVQQATAEPDTRPVAMDKTLDEYVTEFEARIIRQTLERCDGNKSKAARRLGLRPNTLHYKLERYGISTGKKNSGGGK